jgi:MSHA biogenesis protein MshN
MSLINKMLQELDKRHAAQGVSAQPAAQKLGRDLRAVAGGRVGSDVFWWIMATVMLVLIVWLGWVMWQLTPRPIVTDQAFQHRQRMQAVQARPDAGASTVQAGAPVTEQSAAAPAVAGADSGQPGQSTTLQATPSPATPAQTPPASSVARPEATPQIDTLKLATAIGTPIPERRPARATAPAGTPPSAVPVAKPAAAKAEAARSDAPSATKPEPAKVENAKTELARAEIAKAEAAKAELQKLAAKAPAPQVAESKPKPAAEARPPVVATVDPGRIDKRVTSSTQERAESEYRRAVGLVNQGRVAEGMEGFRAALTLDAKHEPSRQTLVSLLMEQRRFDDAFGALQQGLELNPGNSGFAMLTARILVERKDINAALGVLQKHAPSAGSNAEYHAFAAALYQRVGRHSDAVEEYQIALRLSPETGAWWVGLGISQEASDRRKEALGSFKRAYATGNLSSELIAYVDQRMRVLQ